MTEKAIQIVTFTGKRDDWRQWSKKFLAVAERREYRMILETDKEELEVTDDDRKKKNSAAYNDLLLAMTDDVSFDWLMRPVAPITLKDTTNKKSR